MLRKLLPGLSLIAVFAVAEADTLLIDGVQMAQATRTERPARGESMASVEQRFGQPTRTVAAVGEPPITRWEYPTFIVFFEFDHVIHAVPRR